MSEANFMTGATGPTGPMGYFGLTAASATGATGATGPPGSAWPALLSGATGATGATGASFGGSAVVGTGDVRSYSVAEDHSSAHLSHHTITHPGHYYGPAWTTQSHHMLDFPALGLEWLAVGLCVAAVVKKAWDDP